MTSTRSAFAGAKHTPGPWHWSSGTLPRITDEGEIVLTVGNRPPSAKDEANSRLIAAAPDLLVEIENMIRALDGALPELRAAATQEARSNSAPTGLPPRKAKLLILNHAELALGKARAAIAKAEGQS